MPQVYTALPSEAKVNGETIEGLQSIEYREQQEPFTTSARSGPTSGSPSTSG